MTDIDKVAAAIQSLLGKDYTLEIENGAVVRFKFQMYNFYHLLGLHYLTDLPDVARNRHIDEVVKKVLNGKIPLSHLQKSLYFNKIESRISNLHLLREMLICDACQIVVNFDPGLLPKSSIKSEYLLFRREGMCTYYLFGIAHDDSGRYYPETFFVEPSRYYISGQELLNCSISYTVYTSGKKH